MSGGVTCSVACCHSNSQKIKKTGQKMVFHSFPSGELGKEWMRRCHVGKNFIPTNSRRVCSMHFRAVDYEDAMEAKIMRTVPKRLKKDAVPRLRLTTDDRRLQRAPSSNSEGEYGELTIKLNSVVAENDFLKMELAKCKREVDALKAEIREIERRKMPGEDVAVNKSDVQS
ncbi:THAP domain-containing protein 2-like [Cylas formicarius]|uniref:THAP domain-containing protein 2-like n=1 Tax=Cylas formicarius TaxID=197179 RepID=UPI0029588F3E|nr:THAP domain-containing protein 2-like [Cylas formicarius]